MSAYHAHATLQLIGAILDLRPQIILHLVGWRQAVGVEVFFEFSTLMPARPVRPATIVIVVIQDTLLFAIQI